MKYLPKKRDSVRRALMVMTGIVSFVCAAIMPLPAYADDDTGGTTTTPQTTTSSTPTSSSSASTPNSTPSASSMPLVSPTTQPTPTTSPSSVPTVQPTPTQKPVERVNVYRLYNFKSGEHLYTTDAHEVSVLTRGDWWDEGTGWVAPSWSQNPVYRLYNRGLGDHHYTMDAHEIQVLTSRHGWIKEGVAWYSSPGQEVPVYRQYNPSLKVGAHHYTANESEYSVNNSRNGWRGEGIAWYALAVGTPKAHPIASMQTVTAGIADSAARDMTFMAQNYTSSTDWLILINSSTARVGIFQREHGRWWLRHYWAAGPGADRTPTIKGQFTVGNRGYSFGRGYTCYYWVQFYGDYLFHSVLYYQGTRTVKDGTLGRRVSHGCVRLAIENAKWIYDNIPRGTKVVSY